MGPIDAFWHFTNWLLPALAMALLLPAMAKLLWRRELKGVRFGRLALTVGAATLLCLVAGLVLLGRDGRMLTYAALVLASAGALWWAGFGPGKRP